MSPENVGPEAVHFSFGVFCDLCSPPLDPRPRAPGLTSAASLGGLSLIAENLRPQF